MIKTYMQVRLVRAEPAISEGFEGYVVYHADSHSEFVRKAEFEAHVVAIDRHEQQLLAMTTAEAALAQISDGH